jgi:hypothetical protein
MSSMNEARVPGSEAATVAPPSTTTILANRLARLTFHASFEEERFFLILCIFIGVFSGLAVVCFRIAIDWSRIALMGPLPHPSAIRIIGAPTAVGLLVAILVLHFFPEVRGSGVNQTKAALYIYNGYIPFRNAVGKFICSALAIGSGQSLGPEDPSLQIGASLASALGRRLELSREKLRLLCSSSSRKSSDAGARASLAPSSSPPSPAWSSCAGSSAPTPCSASLSPPSFIPQN